MKLINIEKFFKMGKRDRPIKTKNKDDEVVITTKKIRYIDIRIIYRLKEVMRKCYIVSENLRINNLPVIKIYYVDMANSNKEEKTGGNYSIQIQLKLDECFTYTSNNIDIGFDEVSKALTIIVPIDR